MTGLELLRQSGAIITALESPEGMDPADLDPQLEAWLNACDDKLAGCRFAVLRLDVETAALVLLADRLQASIRQLKRNKESVRSIATALLVDRELLGSEAKVKTPEYTAWLQASESCKVVDDPELYPERYHRLRIEPDKAAILADLKLGDEIPGCELVVSRSVRFR